MREIFFLLTLFTISKNHRQLGTAKLPLAEFAKGGHKEKTLPLLDGNGREIQVIDNFFE